MSSNMRLKEIKAYSDKRAILEWETGNIPIEWGMHHVIIGGFDAQECLFTDFLDIKPLPGSEITIVSYELLTSSSESFSWATAGFAEIDETYKEIKGLIKSIEHRTREAHSQQANVKQELPADSVDAFESELLAGHKRVDDADQSGAEIYNGICDDKAKLNEAKNNLARLTRLTCPTGGATIYDPVEVEDLDVWYHSKSTQRGASIRINYQSHSLERTGRFRVSTLWKGMGCSKYYICSITSLAAKICTMSVVVELTPSINIDCNSCAVHLINDSWERATKGVDKPRPIEQVFTAIQSATLTRGCPHKIMIEQFQCSIEAHRIFHQQKSSSVNWALLITTPPGRPEMAPAKIAVNVGGECFGRLTPVFQKQHILIKDLKVDTSVTVVSDLDRPQRLICPDASEKSGEPIAVDILEHRWSFRRPPPFVRLFGPGLSSSRVLLKQAEGFTAYLKPPRKKPCRFRCRYILYFIAIIYIALFMASMADSRRTPHPSRPEEW